MNNVIIIGGGPAGVSASLYTVRAGIKTTVIDSDKSNLTKADKIDNYFGLPSASGFEILTNAKKQAQDLGVEFIRGEVFGIDKTEFFKLETSVGDLTSKAVILAAGSERKTLRLEGLKEFEGSGVSYCAVCDGFFFRNKKIAVIGNSDFALHEYKMLKNITENVILLTNGEEFFLQNSGYQVITNKIKSIYGNGVVEGIAFENGETFALDGVFIALGNIGTGVIARQIGVNIENNLVVTDKDMQTNINGFFAAGDCTNNQKQLSIAVGEGARAALSAIKYIKRKE